MKQNEEGKETEYVTLFIYLDLMNCRWGSMIWAVVALLAKTLCRWGIDDLSWLGAVAALLAKALCWVVDQMNARMKD